MKTFEHKNVKSYEEAVELLSKADLRAQPISGGTDLLGVLKDAVHPETPDLLVNLKTIPDYDRIEVLPDGLHLGAGARLQDIAHHPVIRREYTALAEAARSVATPQIRRMATLAGNLCQEPRCWYYRYPEDAFHCLRKGGVMCGALAGENRFHSIFGAIRVKDTPCTERCPVATLIPDYLKEIRLGEFENAARVLLAANPIPYITGRVCPHFCQEDCNRDEMDESVSIREIERSLGDFILAHGERFYQPPGRESGKRVAIVGSGPAGLAAAIDLRRWGHAVTVFERLPEPGGMLRFAIPEYRLPGTIVGRMIDLLEGMGIAFRCDVEIGKDISADSLRQDFDAVLIATGAWKTPTIGIEGEEYTRSGLDFLKAIRLGQPAATGKKVIVIGGGNVAVDVAMSAHRLGSGSVTMICLEKPEEMPALEWELDQALEENVQIMNSWGPKKVLYRDGKVAGIELVRCVSVFDAQGRFAPRYDLQETQVVEADAVFMSVGQRFEAQALPDGVLWEKGRPAVEIFTGRTNLPGVHLAGDILRPANVIDAVASGRGAALSAHASLGGHQPVENPSPSRFHQANIEGIHNPNAIRNAPRPVAERRIDEEDTQSISAQSAQAEAGRCLNCGCVAVIPSDTAIALIALDAVIHTTRRSIPCGEFFACGVNNSTNLQPGELVTAVSIPKPAEGSRSSYYKFRLRQSIDFPVASAAVRLDWQAEKIQGVRIIMGAVAAVPVRAVEAESFLKGKSRDQALTPGTDSLGLPGGYASELALQGASHLAENAYKIQVARACVRRAVAACIE